MKKMIALLLVVCVMCSMLIVTASAFPATFVAGNDIIIVGNIKVLK